MTAPITPLSPEQIDELCQFDSPTLANALELLNPSWDRASGLMAPHIRPIFPEMKPVAGYACTVLYETRVSAHGHLYTEWQDYWRYVLNVPGPRIAVCQNISARPGEGSLWGEVQANIHRALGCNGAVVEGAVRDLDGMRAVGFACFAREVVVGHGYAHLVECGHTVEVGGVLVESGDLIYADKHGVMVVPHEFAAGLAGMCRKIVEIERPLIATCQDREHFTLEGLTAAFERFSQEYPVDRPNAI
ncbi:MAG: RraA family protein [Chloroflexi bacterium]|nr:RraA family protein [Chloroflexota bacterium]